MDEQLPKYQKDLADFSIEYNPAKAHFIRDRPFILQVSLGDMNLEDAFWVELEPGYLMMHTSEFLDLVFSNDRKQQAEIRSLLDVEENPDLPDMYTELLEVFADWRSGKSTFEFFANQGPEIRSSDRLQDHLSIMQSSKHQIGETPLLDLVIDQKLDVLDYLANAGYFKDKQTMMEFMQANMLMYFLDKHGYKLPVEPIDQADQNLLPIAKKLQSVKLIAPSELEQTFAISEDGRQAISRTIAETESYIDQFDVFKDVYLDGPSGAPEFDTGRGEDLRVQIFEAEDLDPARIVFLLRMYDATFDEVLAVWRESIHSEQFFGEMLSPIVNAERVDEEMLESILEAGYNFNEERFEVAQESESQQEIIDRVHEEAAPPVPVAGDAPHIEPIPSPVESRSEEPKPPDIREVAVPLSTPSEAGSAKPQVVIASSSHPDAVPAPPEITPPRREYPARQPSAEETPPRREYPARQPSAEESPQGAKTPQQLEAVSLTEEGLSLLHEGKFRVSVDYFTRAISRDRGNKQAWLSRAEAYDGLGRRASAAADRRQAETIDDSGSS